MKYVCTRKIDRIKCLLAAVMPLLHGRALKIASLITTVLLVGCAQLLITSNFEELLVSECATIRSGCKVNFLSKKGVFHWKTPLLPIQAPHHCEPRWPSWQQYGGVCHPLVLQQGPQQCGSLHFTTYGARSAKCLSVYLPACLRNPPLMPKGIFTNGCWRRS